MEFIVRGALGEMRSHFPATLVSDGTSFRLEGRDRSGLDLSRLAEGETVTAHVVEGGVAEEDVAFALTRQDGELHLLRANGDMRLDPALFRGTPQHAFAPWKAIVRDGTRVVESWPETSEAYARNTAELRRSEHSRDRWNRYDVTVERAPRMAAADFEPSAGPRMG